MAASTEVVPARINQPPFVNNLLVNPGFEIWQRGNGPFTVNYGFSCDEWRLRFDAGSGESLSVSRSSSALYGSYALLVNSSVGTTLIDQGIEAYKSLEDKWVTFSCWVKASLGDAVKLWLRDYSGSSSGADSPYHSGSDQWEQLVVTYKIRTGLTSPGITFPHGFGLRVALRFTQNVSNVLFDGAVLAQGYFPEGIPYVPLHPAEDLERCQRFYQTSGGDPYNGSIFRQDVVSGSNYFADHFFQTPMYATPTLTITNGNNKGFGASPAGTQVDRKGFKEWRTATATAASRYFWSYWEAEVS